MSDCIRLEAGKFYLTEDYHPRCELFLKSENKKVFSSGVLDPGIIFGNMLFDGAMEYDYLTNELIDFNKLDIPFSALVILLYGKKFDYVSPYFSVLSISEKSVPSPFISIDDFVKYELNPADYLNGLHKDGTVIYWAKDLLHSCPIEKMPSVYDENSIHLELPLEDWKILFNWFFHFFAINSFWIKRCKHCGKFYAAKNGHSLYCSRITDGKSCETIADIKKHVEKDGPARKQYKSRVQAFSQRLKTYQSRLEEARKDDNKDLLFALSGAINDCYRVETEMKTFWQRNWQTMSEDELVQKLKEFKLPELIKTNNIRRKRY